MTYTIGFIGAGNMARSLAGGLLQQGWPKAQLRLADPDAQQRALALQTLGLAVGADNGVPAAADVVVLAVKPQIMRAVCLDLARHGAAPGRVIVSIAAGIRTDDLARWLGPGCAIVRAMPNTPALLRLGATGLYANAHVDAAQRERAQALMAAVGKALWVDREALIDAVTALSGSGPAYVFRLIEAMERAGIEQGLAPEVARSLSLQTALGAATMAAQSSETAAVLRARVTSPGGTTERALQVLEQDHGGIDALMRRAIAAAAERARELAQQFGRDDSSNGK